MPQLYNNCGSLQSFQSFFFSLTCFLLFCPASFSSGSTVTSGLASLATFLWQPDAIVPLGRPSSLFLKLFLFLLWTRRRRLTRNSLCCEACEKSSSSLLSCRSPSSVVGEEELLRSELSFRVVWSLKARSWLQNTMALDLCFTFLGSSDKLPSDGSWLKLSLTPTKTTFFASCRHVRDAQRVRFLVSSLLCSEIHSVSWITSSLWSPVCGKKSQGGLLSIRRLIQPRLARGSRVGCSRGTGSDMVLSLLLDLWVIGELDIEGQQKKKKKNIRHPMDKAVWLLLLKSGTQSEPVVKVLYYQL